MSDLRVHGLWGGCLISWVALAGLAASVPAKAATILVIGDAATGKVGFFNASSGAPLYTTPLPPVSGNPGSPSGLIFGTDGNLYVADQANNVIDEINPANGNFIGDFVTAGSGAGALNSPSGIAFGPDGNLYIDNLGVGGSSYINEYVGPNGLTPGVFIRQFVAPGAGPSGGLFFSNGLVFHNGNLYVADASNGEIAEFNGTTGAYTQFVPPGNPPSPLANPQALTFDALGNLYVTDLTTGVLYEYSASGTYIGTFGSTVLGAPIGLAFGPGGNLFVADSSSGEIAEFSGTNGALLTSDFAPGGNLNSPQFLAFSPTSSAPEPSTFILFALAAIALGCLRRGRSSVSSKHPAPIANHITAS